MSTPEIAKLLRAIADVIEKDSPSEISAITLALKKSALGARGEKKKSASKGENKKECDLDAVATRIIASADRISAMSVLKDVQLSRRELRLLGNKHNVHIVKEDTIENIETKIVEALVGSRLSSKAIRGEF